MVLSTSDTNMNNVMNIHIQFHTNSTIHIHIGSIMDNRTSFETDANTNIMINTQIDIFSFFLISSLILILILA